MPIRVQLPNGSFAEFPDGMATADIEAVLARQFGAPEPPDFGNVQGGVASTERTIEQPLSRQQRNEVNDLIGIEREPDRGNIYGEIASAMPFRFAEAAGNLAQFPATAYRAINNTVGNLTGYEHAPGLATGVLVGGLDAVHDVLTKPAADARKAGYGTPTRGADDFLEAVNPNANANRQREAEAFGGKGAPYQRMGLMDRATTIADTIGQNALASAPDMAMAVGATIPYFLSYGNQATNERATNDKRAGQPTISDLGIGMADSAVQTFLERWATSRLFKGTGNSLAPGVAAAAARIAKETGLQAATEFLEESVDYAATHFGTEKGGNLADMGKQGLMGAITGGPMGTVAQGVHEGMAATDPLSRFADASREGLRDYIANPKTSQEQRLAAAMELAQRGEWADKAGKQRNIDALSGLTRADGRVTLASTDDEERSSALSPATISAGNAALQTPPVTPSEAVAGPLKPAAQRGEAMADAILGKAKSRRLMADPILDTAALERAGISPIVPPVERPDVFTPELYAALGIQPEPTRDLERLLPESAVPSAPPPVQLDSRPAPVAAPQNLPAPLDTQAASTAQPAEPAAQPFLPERTSGQANPLEAGRLDVPVRPEPTAAPAPVSRDVVGAQAQALTPARAPMSVRVGGDAQAPQHAPTMQNRDRSRAASVSQMQDIRRNPDPERLGFSRDPNTGAPMVGAGKAIPDADRGRTDTVIMASGRRVPVQYAVVEADELAASHDADGRVNPAYDAAPLKALNNGRTAGLQAAYASGNTDAYRQGIAADAALHGVPAEAIAGKRKPVLVRLYDPEQNSGDMGAESNATQQLGLSPVEQAQTDARALPDLSGMVWNEDGSISPSGNANFFRGWFANMGETQAASLQDAQGRPNAMALQRVRGAMVHRAYGDERLLTAMAEEIDPDNRNVMNALVQAAPGFAKLDDTPHVSDVKAALVGGLTLLRDAKARGIKLADALAQQDMFGRNADADAVAAFMAANARSANRMAEAFKAVAEYAARAETQAATLDVFGSAPEPSVTDALGDAGITEKRYGTETWRDGGAVAEGRGGGQQAQEQGAAAGDAFRLDAGAQAQPAAQEVAPPPSAGLFGAPSARDYIDAAQRNKDAARDGKTGTGRTDMLAGDGELFAGPRPEQAEIPAPSQQQADAEVIEITDAQGRVPMAMVAEVQGATGFTAQTMTSSGGVARFNSTEKLGGWQTTIKQSALVNRVISVRVAEDGTATVTDTTENRRSGDEIASTTRTVQSGITPDNWTKATSAFLSGLAPNAYAKYDTAAKLYGRGVTADGTILKSDGKPTSLRVREKAGRLRVESESGKLVFSGAANGDALGKFMESYWGASKVKAASGKQADVEAKFSMPDKALDLSPTNGTREAKIGDTTLTYGVSRDGQTVEVVLIRTPKAKRGAGGARRAMTSLLAEADANGQRVVLTPEPMDAATSKAKLESFYRSLGFKPNSGRSRDFTTRAAMIREPGSKFSIPASEREANLRRWFGDSKVVDADGNPLVVYHGTSKRFSKINMRKGAQGLFWMTSDRDAIERGEVGAAERGVIMPLYAKITKPAGWDEYDRWGIAELKREGYDGLMLPDGDGAFTVAAFSPDQIKSADRNNGNFDSGDLSILRSQPADTAGSLESPEALLAELKSSPVGRSLAALERAGVLDIIHDPKQPWAGKWDGRRATLNAAQIPAGKGIGVALHELGVHAERDNLQGILGDAGFNALLATIDRWADSSDPVTRDLAANVQRRVNNANTPAKHRDEERLAYAVELAANAGMESGGEIRAFLRRFAAYVKAWLSASKLGSALRARGLNFDLTPQDVAQLAAYAVARQARAVSPSRAMQAAEAYSRPAVEQTQSEAFRKWFGDSVVTENGKAGGKPLVVYHGTRGSFDTFKDGPTWFHTDPRQAFASGDGASVMPAYVKIERPLRRAGYFGMEDFSSPERFKWFDKAAQEWVTPDGVIGDNGVVVAFRPNQIKSATGNSGAFDPENPSILASMPDAGVEFTNGQEALESRLAQWAAALHLRGGSPRAIEASPETVGAVTRNAGGAAEQGDASRTEIREQSARLIERAKAEGFYWPDDSPILAELGKLPTLAGAEHQVFVVGEGNNRLVIRATDNGFFGHRSDISPAQYLARLDDYSRTFPSLQTRLIGVSESADVEGHAVIWTAQTFVYGKKFKTQALLAEAMAGRGWQEDGHPGVPRFKHESGAIIEDAHTDNVFQDDNGDLYPFDVVVEALPNVRYSMPEFDPATATSESIIRDGRLLSLIDAVKAANGDLSAIRQAVADRSLSALTQAIDDVLPSLRPKRVTGIKNAVTDAERAAAGRDPILRDAIKTNEETLVAAMRELRDDPNAGEEVVARLTRGGEMSLADEGILLVYKTDLLNKRAAAADTLADTDASESRKAVARQAWADAEAKIAAVDMAASAIGTEAGRMLQFRQRMLREDFTFAALERKERARLERPLTPAESATIKAMADTIAEMQAKVDALQARIANAESEGAYEDLVKRMARPSKQRPTLTSLRSKADAARARLAATQGVQSRRRQSGAVISPTAFYDLAVIGAYHVANGAAKFSDWVVAMRADIGAAFDTFKADHPNIFKASQAELEKPLKAEASVAEVMEKIDLANVTSKDVRKLIEALVGEGMRGEQAVIAAAAEKLELEESDVRSLFVQTSPKPQPTLTEAQEELRDLRKLVRLQAEIDRITAGQPKPSRGPAPPDSPAVAEKKRQLAELRASLKPVRDPEGRYQEMRGKQIAKRIKEIEDRIRAGDFAARPRVPRKLNEANQRAQYELDKVKEAFLRHQFMEMLKARSKWGKALGFVGDSLNLSRALMTSLDFSGLLRQGGFVTFGHPVMGGKAFAQTLGALVSERAEHAIMSEIKARPNARLYEKHKLALTGIGFDRGGLSKIEENYASRWIDMAALANEKDGSVRHRLRLLATMPVRASGRVYVSFLNRLRADAFDALAATMSKTGVPTEAEAQHIADFVNTATGRGKIPRNWDGLNTVAFAPRLVASRFSLATFTPIITAPTGRMKAQIATEYARTLIGVGVVMSLLAYGFGGDDENEWWESINFDPRSADFMKLRFGDTRIDPFMGLSQVAVLMARLGTGETVTSGGDLKPLRSVRTWTDLRRQFDPSIPAHEVGENGEMPFGARGLAEAVFSFIRSKANPATGAAMNFVFGQNFIGEPTTVAGEAKNLLVPMSIPSIFEAMEDQGVPRGAALGLLSLFGMSLQVHTKSNEDQLKEFDKATDALRAEVKERLSKLPQDQWQSALSAMDKEYEGVLAGVRLDTYKGDYTDAKGVFHEAGSPKVDKEGRPKLKYGRLSEGQEDEYRANAGAQPGDEAHHIIADNLVRRHKLMVHARMAGYDLNHPGNMIALPANPTGAKVGHNTDHPKYDAEVIGLLNENMKRLNREYGSLRNAPPAEVLDAVRKIEAEMRKRIEKRDVPIKDGRLAMLGRAVSTA